jgi:hypothetical protein
MMTEEADKAVEDSDQGEAGRPNVRLTEKDIAWIRISFECGGNATEATVSYAVVLLSVVG